jgi:hypothetical protein
MILSKEKVELTKTFYFEQIPTSLSVRTLIKFMQKTRNYRKVSSRSEASIQVMGKYSDSQSELLQILSKYKNKICLTLPNSTQFSYKKNLALNCRDWGITPTSFALPEEWNKLKLYKKIFPEQKFVFKTDQHKQKGIYISKKLPLYSTIKAKNYIVAQKFLSDCLKFKNKKVTIRFYLVVSVDSQADVTAWMSDDGIVTYAKSDITSFYNKDWYNKGWPIAIKTLFKNKKDDYKKVFVQSKYLLMKMVMACSEYIKNGMVVSRSGNKCYEIFGVDFLINSNLTHIHIIEANAGPGMDAHNKIDAKCRFKILNDYVNLIEIGKTDMIKIID